MARIRAADPVDSAAIGDILARSYGALLAEIAPHAVLTPPARASREVAPVGRRRIWVIEHGGAIAGMASTAPTRDLDDDAARTSEIVQLYVVPEAWGQGLGRALLEHAIDDLGQRGWREVAVWVIDANARARRLYERAGFTFDGARRTIERAGVLFVTLRYRRDMCRLPPLISGGN